jgi:hypothetical protein
LSDEERKEKEKKRKLTGKYSGQANLSLFVVPHLFPPKVTDQRIKIKINLL